MGKKDTTKTNRALFSLFVLSILCSLAGSLPAQAGSYQLNYHTTPNSSGCSWVYRWKWVYGKRVKVRVKVCN